MLYELPASLPAEIDRLSALVEEFTRGRVHAAELKAHRVPFGVYEQRRNGSYMARIRCPGGAITPSQLTAAARLSREHGSGFLHLTTRQELQIHDVAIGRVVPLIRELFASGLATRGGGGNTVRNIIAPADAGVDPGELLDVTPYARALTSRFLAEPDSWVLPRKLKIAFSGDERDRVRAAFNDLGFIATRRGDSLGFRVLVAGGLGSKPQVGAVLHDFVPLEDAYVVARAIKQLFDRWGNRKNRHAARLRFLWSALGEREFVARYRKELDGVRSEPPVPLALPPSPAALAPVTTSGPPPVGADDLARWRSRFVEPQRRPGLYTVLVPVQAGNLPSADAESIAQLASRFGHDAIRVTVAQNLLLRHVPEAQLAHVFAEVTAVAPLAAKPRLFGQAVVCTGADTCRLGICLSKNAQAAVFRGLEHESSDLDRLGDLRLHISGCPNNCGQHSAADLGFFGKASRDERRLYPAYRVVAGARTGAAPRLGRELGEVSARSLPETVTRILQHYLGHQDAYASFGAFVDGEESTLRTLIDQLGTVPSFDDDKSCYFDWGADEPFSLAGKGTGECSAGLFDLIELDLGRIRALRGRLVATPQEASLLAELALASARMLLVTRGAEPRSDAEVFELFARHFIDAGLVDGGFRAVVDAARDGDEAALIGLRDSVLALATAVESLYSAMDDSLRFPSELATAAAPAPVAAAALHRDYRGVACPMNFVKVKLDLARMKNGEILEVLLDDGAPIENVPRSVAQEGHEILSQRRHETAWAVLVRRRP